MKYRNPKPSVDPVPADMQVFLTHTGDEAIVTTRTKTQDPSQLEKSLGDLEKIVENLEGGELPLDAALKQFEKGVGLSRDCQKALDAAEQRVSMLAGDKLEQRDGDSSAGN